MRSAAAVAVARSRSAAPNCRRMVLGLLVGIVADGRARVPAVTDVELDVVADDVDGVWREAAGTRRGAGAAA